MKYAIGLILVLLGASMAFAIAPAESWTAVSTGKYLSLNNASYTTSGGNVTQLNISSNVSTNKWAGFWGNISGVIILSQGLGNETMYRWSWTSSSGGRVCAVAAASGFNWALVAPVSASAINTMWSFGTAADNATKTLTTNSSTTVGGINVINSAANTTGVGGFTTIAMSDGATAAKSDFAFCTNITNGGSLFNGKKGDYELIVPTNKVFGSTETYYAWVELE